MKYDSLDSFELGLHVLFPLTEFAEGEVEGEVQSEEEEQGEEEEEEDEETQEETQPEVRKTTRLLLANFPFLLNVLIYFFSAGGAGAGRARGCLQEYPT